MTLLESLNGLKKFIEDEVANEIKLQKEKSNPIEYVHPYVALMSLPHKNFLPSNVDFQVPFILVGFSNKSSHSDENVVAIRILCATYGGNMIEGVNIPDETGYIDMINLLERIETKLVEKAVINGVGTVERPINSGIYDTEITYPYWYGYMQFDLQIPVVEYPLHDF